MTATATTIPAETSTWVRLLIRKSRALSISVVNSSGALSSFWVILRRWVVGGIECSSGRRPAEDHRRSQRARAYILYLKSSGDIRSRISDHLSRETLARF